MDPNPKPIIAQAAEIGFSYNGSRFVSDDESLSSLQMSARLSELEMIRLGSVDKINVPRHYPEPSNLPIRMLISGRAITYSSQYYLNREEKA